MITAPHVDAHRIAPKLWMGGVPGRSAAKIFEVIVLCAEEDQPSLPCHVIRAPMDDAEPTAREVEMAIRTAKNVNALRAKGKRVLVTCHAGVNRSGLVAALALMLDGLSARAAVGLVRQNRHPPCGWTPLTNKHFVKLLMRVEPVLRGTLPYARYESGPYSSSFE